MGSDDVVARVGCYCQGDVVAVVRDAGDDFTDGSVADLEFFADFEFFIGLSGVQAAFQVAEVLGAGDNFLAEIAALIEIDGLEVV